jgi:beta-lactamase superfamily II metal-dependent hydrolase
MNCEIEFLPVGEKSKPGDAVVVRYGDANGYKLMLVDGGHADTGKQIVEHIQSQFGTNSVISHLVLTHSDTDHVSGIREVLSELPVENLWLHLPWLSAAAARPYFADKRWTDDGLAEEIRKRHDMIDEIVTAAWAKKTIKVYQPFAGSTIGPFRVLSPSKVAYPLLLPQFDNTPDPDKEAIEAAGLWVGKQPGTIARAFDKAAAVVQKWVNESWDKELLKDGGVTSARNETSVVLYADLGVGRRLLLTGDAGIWGLTMSAEYAEQNQLPLKDFAFVQIPHHGSRRNVGPTILDRLLGPVRPEIAIRNTSAFVSAPKDDATHPRKMVLNAFMRRGCEYVATQGGKKVFWGGFPHRPGYEDLPPCQFNTEVEEYD